MERTRIARVDDVRLVRRGEQTEGTLHLTPHHLIFVSQDGGSDAKPKELWITYPIIQTCILKPTPAVTHIPSSIRLRCRDFSFVCFCFQDEKKARDVYDSIRAWTCKLGRIDKLYAFSYESHKVERGVNGWDCYDARREWKRQGISEKDVDKGWRITNINHDYEFSPTYPAVLAVPSLISDTTLNYAVKYRSKERLPVLTYLHPVNNCSITRSSQPMTGLKGSRSIQDEKLLLSIFSTTTPSPKSSPRPSRPRSPNSLQSSGEIAADRGRAESPFDAERLEDEIISRLENSESADGPQIYGAQRRNLIVDARPIVNAIAMQATGRGSENMANYPFASKIYLGIDNIHKMRKSLAKVVDALKESDLTPLPPNRELLARSDWLKHITGVLNGVSIIARQVAVQHSHVLIHCSDGWDRTSQLSALSQLCLDPYYRTIDGFITLIEKDWLSFGHMFQHRSGFLSSEKWFSIENERIGGESTNSSPNLVKSSSGTGNALENAFLSAKGLFTKDNTSKESVVDSDGEMHPYDVANPGPRKKATIKDSKDHITKTDETAPIFHQFLDATYQLLRQHPSRFEFNERFLRRLLYHLYSCQYGTFLFNSEKERLDNNLRERTKSVWDYFLARKEQFINEKYDSVIDDNIRGKERLILPNDEVRWWFELFGRTDAEMNGPPVPSSTHLTPTKSRLSTTSNTRSPQPSFDRVRSPQSAVRQTVDLTPPPPAAMIESIHSLPTDSDHDTVITGGETANTAIGAGISGQEINGLSSSNADPLAVMDDVPERKVNGVRTNGITATSSSGSTTLSNGIASLGLGEEGNPDRREELRKKMTKEIEMEVQ